MPSVFDYAQSRETDPGFEPPRPDYGPGHAFTQAFKQGVESNFTGMGLRALKYWKLKTGAVMLPETGGGFIDKDTFDRDFSLSGALKFDPHHEGKMSRGYAQALMEDRLDDEFTKAQAGLSYSPVSSFVGSLAGGLLSPVDLAVNLAIPEYTFVKFGMGASVASRAGTGVARIASRTINGAVNGTAQAIAFQLPMAALATHNQTEYTLEDAITNIGMGPLMGGAAGLLHGTARHVAGEWDRKFANAVMHAAATDKDPSIAAKIASEDPRMKQSLDFRQQIKEIFNKAERTTADDEIIHMASDGVPEDMPSGVPPDKARNNKRVLEDILSDPEDRRIRGAASDDERFLSEAWKTLFGVDLRYVSKDLGRSMGFMGFTKSSEPSKAYIVEGALNNGRPDSMMFVAGHELGHSVRLRDPNLWSSIVSTMMDTSKQEGGGAIGAAWKTVVRHNRSSGVWEGLPHMSQRMDETFATVLGQAMQEPKFWDTLRQTSPEANKKLSYIVYHKLNQLKNLLQSRISPETKALYEGLSNALMRSGLDEKTAPAEEAAKLHELYKPHVREFKRVTKMYSALLTKEGQAYADELDAFFRWSDTLFPQVASFEDNSATPRNHGRFASIRRNVRINSDSPAFWVIQNIFARSAEGTPEHKLAQEFAQGVFDWDRKSRTAKGDKDYAPSALKSGGPLAAFKKNADGTWDIGVFRNDDFPRWHELFDTMKPEVELVSRAFIEENLHEVRGAFRAFVNDVESGVPSREFDSYLSSLGERELDLLLNEDPDALWQGYAEHLEERMGEYRLANDQKAYANLAEQRRQVDPLLRAAGEGEANKAVGAEDLKKAWAGFLKEYAAIKDKLNERNLELAGDALTQGPVSWGAAVDPTPEFFTQLRKEVRSELLFELSEQRQMMDRLRAAKEGDFGLMDSKGRSFFARDSAKLDARMEAMLDKMVDERIRDSGRWPQYDKVMNIAKAVESADAETISLHSVTAKDLPDKFKDANERFDEIDVMSDLSDEFNFMSSARSISEDEANLLARIRLDREHATWSKFLTSFEQSVQSRIDEGIERNKLDGWTLDPKPKPAAGTTPAPEPKGPLADTMNAVKGQYELSNKVLSGVAAGKPVKKGLEDLTRSITERFEYHLRQSTDRRAAASAVSMDLRRDAQSKLLRAIQHHEATTSLIGRAKAGLDALYSYLDGIARKDVPAAGASVAEAMSSRVVADSAPLARDLVNSGLDTLWVNNDEALMRALIGHMKGTKISVDPMVKTLADTLRKTQEVQTGRLNANGANIRLLEGFVFSQVHNPHYIGRSAAEFISDVNAWLDWDATERMQGPNTPQGTFDRALYLKQLQFELAKKDRPLPAGFDPETMGGNIASSVSHRRTLHFKDTFAFDYDTKYGSGNTAGLITEQIIKRAELGTVMEHFGPDYKKTWNHVMRELGRPGEWRSSKIGRIDLTFQNLVGDLNHPEDVKIAAIGQAVRQAMNSVSLWLSGVSSVTDLGNATSTMTWMGMSPSGMNKALFSAMTEQVSKDPKNRQFLLAQGAGLQAILSAFARTQVMDGPAYRLAQKASDFTFKYNGQELWTKTLQSAFHDLTTQHLGEMAKGTTPEFINWLSHYGITVEEWKGMSQHAVEIDGLQGVRLAPDLIPNEALATKLRVAMSDSMHQAILEPTVSDRALATWGTKAGTPYGEAVRTVMQYKTYPMAMLRRVQRRFANAYGNEGLYAFGKGVNHGQLAWLTWAGSMLSLAATALAIKDLARGREPLNPFDTDQWTIGNASRIVSQAGIGPFAVAEQFLSPHQALGPAFGSAYSIGRGIATGNGYATTNAILGSTPIVAAAPIKEASKAILGSIFTEAYGVHYQQFLQQLEAETGQTSIFLDKK